MAVSKLASIRVVASAAILGDRDCLGVSSRLLGGKAVPSMAIEPPARPSNYLSSAAELWAEDTLDPKLFATVWRRTVLEGCKWDPRVGDASTLASFPVVMKRSTWNRL